MERKAEARRGKRIPGLYFPAKLFVASCDAKETLDRVCAFLLEEGVPAHPGDWAALGAHFEHGLHTFCYGHVVGDVPVLGVRLVVLVAEDGFVRQVAVSDRPAVGLRIGAEMRMSAGESEEIAQRLLRGGKLRKEAETHKVFYRRGHELRPGYVVFLATEEPIHDYRITVDGEDGSTEAVDLLRRTISVQLHDPNPILETGNPSLLANATPTPGWFTNKSVNLSSGDPIENAGVRVVKIGPPDIADIVSVPATWSFTNAVQRRQFAALMAYQDVTRFLADVAEPSAVGLTVPPSLVPIIIDPLNGAYPASSSFSPSDRKIRLVAGNGTTVPDQAQDAEVILHEVTHAWMAARYTGAAFGPEDVEHTGMNEGVADLVAMIWFASKKKLFAAANGPQYRRWFAEWGKPRATAAALTPPGIRELHNAGAYPSASADPYDRGRILGEAMWRALIRATDDHGYATNQVGYSLLRALLSAAVANATTLPTCAGAVLSVHEANPADRGRHLASLLQGFTQKSILPAGTATLWMKDYPLDTSGAAASPPPTFWYSPDVWVRNTADGLPDHQEPIPGIDNHIYARVRSSGGVAERFVVTFTVKTSTTEAVYPTDFFNSQVVGAVLGPAVNGAGAHVVHLRWPADRVPPAGTHCCILANVVQGHLNPIPNGARVWQRRELAQRNVNVLSIAPRMSAKMPFQIGSQGQFGPRTVRLEIQRRGESKQLVLGLRHRSRETLERLAAPPEEDLVSASQLGGVQLLSPANIRVQGADGQDTRMRLQAGSVVYPPGAPRRSPPSFFRSDVTLRDVEGAEPTLLFAPLARAGLPITLEDREVLHLVLYVRVPSTAKPGTVYTFDIVQRNVEGVAGGIRVVVRVPPFNDI